MKIYKISIALISAILLTLSCTANPEFTREELEDPDLLLDKGRDLFFEEDYDAAIICFEIIIDKFPRRTYNASWAQYEMGMAYYLNKDYQKAREAFVNVLKIYNFPKQPRILSLKLIRKIDKEQEYKRSSYSD